ncbi:hypothetical protein NMG60_11008489 [Bertholletia excelsa]
MTTTMTRLHREDNNWVAEQGQRLEGSSIPPSNAKNLYLHTQNTDSHPSHWGSRRVPERREKEGKLRTASNFSARASLPRSPSKPPPCAFIISTLRMLLLVALKRNFRKQANLFQPVDRRSARRKWKTEAARKGRKNLAFRSFIGFFLGLSTGQKIDGRPQNGTREWTR